MRAVQLVLLSAILVVLQVIAHDLHRIAYAIPIVGDRPAVATVATATTPETPEQHRARIEREAQRQNQLTNDQVEVFKRQLELDRNKPSK
jgi:hypothetical protein